MENSKSGGVRKVKYLTTKSHHLLLLNDSNANVNSIASPESPNADASKKSYPTNTGTTNCKEQLAASANKIKSKPRVEKEKVKVKVKVSSSGICKFEAAPKKSSAKSAPNPPVKSRNSKIPETKSFKIVKKRSPDSLKAASKPKKQSKAAAIQEYVFYDSDEDITNGPAASKAKIAELQRATLISKCSVTVHDNLNILTAKSLPSFFLKNKDKGNQIDSTKDKSTTVTKTVDLPKPVKEKPVPKPSKEKPEAQARKPKAPPKVAPAETKPVSTDDPPPPKKPRKLRKPTAEESVVEGFAFLAFKTYEDLTRAVAVAEGTSCPHQVAKCVQLVKGKVSKGKALENGGKPEKSEFKTEKRAKNTAKTAMSAVNAGIRPSGSAPEKISKKSTATASVSPQNCAKVKKTHPPKSVSGSSSMNGKGKETKSTSPDAKPKKVPVPKDKKVKSGIPESQQRTWPHSFKISDGCTDLFASLRKDSSPNQLADNLHSPLEKARERERGRERGDTSPAASNREIKSLGSPPSITAAVAAVTVSGPETSSPPTLSLSRSPSSSPPGSTLKQRSVAVAVNTDADIDDDSGHDSPSTTPRIHLNGPLSLTNQDRNGLGRGQSDDNRSPESPSLLPTDTATVSPKTPRAATPPPHPPSRPTVTLPPKKDKSRTPKQKGKAMAKVTQHKLFTPYATTSITTRTSTPTTDSNSYIAVLSGHFPERRHELDCNSNSNSSSSSSSLPYPGKEVCTDAATYINSITGHHPQPLSPLVIDKSIGPPPNILSTFNCKAPPSSRSGSSSSGSTKSTSTGFESIARLLDSSNTKPSKRSGSPIPKSSKAHKSGSGSGGHGGRGNTSSQSPPCRERDNYSSASSLSRGSSVTPSNGSGFSQQLPSNLSPLQDLSRVKATSWLSGAAEHSPAPRPTLPPASSGSSSSTPQSTHSIYSGPPPGMPPSSHHSQMYPPGMLPLHGSMMGPGQHSPFGPASNELVRRDLEARFLAERAAAGGPNSFMPRSGELHPHHLLHMQSQGGPTPAQPPHSPLFSAPYYKDMPKMGLDSPFYRSSLGLPYAGFNGMLPPSNLTTPFTPPSQLPTFTPKKSGRWNAMHVRISWEVYQNQQKEAAQEKAATEQATREGSTTTSASEATTNSSTTSSSSSANCGRNSDSNNASVTVMPLGALDPANRSNHSLPDLHRSGEINGPGLPPLLPPGNQPPPFDPNSPLFMQSPPLLAPPLGRGFPPFGSLGPAFGGLGGIGPNILGRDISSLGALPPSHDQWLRMQRAAQFPNWPMMPREKPDERDEKRNSENKGGSRDHPPRARSRSPHRSSRASAENGDTGSRSSSGNSTSAISSAHKSRENSVDKDKSGAVPLSMEREQERDKLSAAHQSLMNDKALPFIPSTYSSRMFSPGSPLTGWDTFPGMTAAQRAALAAEPYRQSLLQLSERERELARAPIRPSLPGNGNGPPFMSLPLLSLGAGGPPPPRTAASAMGMGLVGGSKGSGSIPLLNPSMSIGALSGHSFHGHHHSSLGLNGPPNNGGSPSSRTKEDSHSR